jgi:hypothetical protein
LSAISVSIAGILKSVIDVEEDDEDEPLDVPELV